MKLKFFIIICVYLFCCSLAISDNLVNNGDFKYGKARWKYKYCKAKSITENENKFIKIPLNEKVSVAFYQKISKLKKAKKIKISLKVKRSEDHKLSNSSYTTRGKTFIYAPFVVFLHSKKNSGGYGSGFKNDKEIGTEWIECVQEVKVKDKTYTELQISCRAGSGALFFDDIQVEILE